MKSFAGVVTAAIVVGIAVYFGAIPFAIRTAQASQIGQAIQVVADAQAVARDVDGVYSTDAAALVSGEFGVAASVPSGSRVSVSVDQTQGGYLIVFVSASGDYFYGGASGETRSGTSSFNSELAADVAPDVELPEDFTPDFRLF
ncbi:hypothetical protein [Herbiconiux sp. UC225_62]|uniref:hypothetical protein n=1 Tax=Herbiconiux sp. UC225_62 TaxID=3350168 RepID=UPI0036D2F4FC